MNAEPWEEQPELLITETYSKPQALFLNTMFPVWLEALHKQTDEQTKAHGVEE